MVALDKESLRRLDTWIGLIARALRPDAPVASTADGLRLGRKGSLSISANGWYDFEASVSGRDALTLIQHLRGRSAEDATYFALDWLGRHPGEGDFAAVADFEAADAAAKRVLWATRLLDEVVDLPGTPGETYLRKRGLLPPYPPCARWLDDVRIGEGAVVGVLSDEAGEAHGVQLGYVSPDGCKSVVKPQRQLFLVNREAARQSGFRINVAGPVKGAPDYVITEGLENALALAQVSAAKTIIGVPGGGRLKDITFPSGATVVAVRDGKDDADSPAAKSFTTALDEWLVAGVAVKVTATPPGQDANSLLIEHGGDELLRLVSEAEPALPTTEADIKRLAKLDRLQYEKERAEVAKRHKLRKLVLDVSVGVERDKAKKDADVADASHLPYPEPVEDLAALLDEALNEFTRYVIASETMLTTVVLWCAHAHLVHNERAHLWVSPRLAIQSPVMGCGKSLLLECVACLVPRQETASSITAASIFRVIDDQRPTLLIDEADRVIRGDNPDLLAVLNSSHRRGNAYVMRCVEQGGEQIVKKFNTWTAMALAGIKELPPTLQDRSVVVRLRRALPSEPREHLQDGSSPKLLEIRRKLIRWSQDLGAFPRVTLPKFLNNRLGDNWRPLFGIAELAGGDWPTRVEAAATTAAATHTDDGVLVALLAGIKTAFAEKTKMGSLELIDALLKDDAFDWAAAHKGKPINEFYLGRELRGILNPPLIKGRISEQWRQGKSIVRGYTRDRFCDAWSRYTFPEPPKSGDTGDIGDAGDKPLEERDISCHQSGSSSGDTDGVGDLGDTKVDEAVTSQGCPHTQDSIGDTKTPDEFNAVTSVTNVTSSLGGSGEKISGAGQNGNGVGGDGGVDTPTEPNASAVTKRPGDGQAADPGGWEPL